MGDYITMVSDNTGGNVAYCATFNGEEDIYYVRVAPAGPVAQNAVLPKGSTAPPAISISVAAHRHAGNRMPFRWRDHDYQLIVTFPSSVTVTGSPQAQVTAGAGDVGTAGSPKGGMVAVSGSIVTVPLTNIANAQTVNITLFGVSDGSGTGNTVIPMSVLVGDTNGNRAVNASDAAIAKSEIGQPIDAMTFRADVNANGVINSADVGLIKSNIGNGVP